MRCISRKALRTLALGRVIEARIARSIANGIDGSNSAQGEGASPSPGARPGSSNRTLWTKNPVQPSILRSWREAHGPRCHGLADGGPHRSRTPRQALRSLGASMCSPGSDEPGASRQSPAASGRPRSASSATFAFKSPENLRLLFIAYPSLVGGIHLKQLSDFPGPPQSTYFEGRGEIRRTQMDARIRDTRSSLSSSSPTRVD